MISFCIWNSMKLILLSFNIWLKFVLSIPCCAALRHCYDWKMLLLLQVAASNCRPYLMISTLGGSACGIGGR